jgi:putative two-component system response regulator
MPCDLTTRETDQPRGTILVVDDEHHVRTILSRWLTGAGYHVVAASDADLALVRLQEHECRLATLDINMPGRSGLELLPLIKLQSPDCEVLMLTARDEAETAIAALTGGAYGYLMKPVCEAELLLQVERALTHRQLILDHRRYLQTLESRVREQTAAVRRAHEETIHRLVTASTFRDEETGAHIRRTGLYSALFAEAIGWSVSRIDDIRLAAPMHDVGKIAIPDAILRKPGKLTPREYEIMKTHAAIGGRMLSGSEAPMLQMAEQIAWCHHERWDGTGYPRGLRNDEIPEPARILAIADVYDALTHDRVYRPALLEDHVLALMRDEQGRQFAPLLYSVFEELLPEMRRIADENPDDADSAPDGISIEALLEEFAPAGV